MSKAVDLELKRAFTELQQKMLETTHKLKLADVQIDNLKRSMQHAQLTEKEISSLDPGTNTYESVGRMFILTDIPEVCKHLQTKSQACSEKIKTLESNKSYLERSLKDSENNLREMVQQRKEMAQESS
ncbi:prefoldin subunit 1 [Periplaneta americana]|uniref:prefoldin subunit 1 n=1 Tax=Periplaneta americana TaxID=6978 RepID=UPI0037E75C61